MNRIDATVAQPSQNAPVAQWIEQRFYTRKRRFNRSIKPFSHSSVSVLSTARDLVKSAQAVAQLLRPAWRLIRRKLAERRSRRVPDAHNRNESRLDSAPYSGSSAPVVEHREEFVSDR
jgi:hypothetical protein